MNIRRNLSSLCFSVALALPCLGLAQESIRRNDMYDYDQRRNALPDDGKYHCVPTSYVDMFKYMDTHGLTSMNGNFGTSYDQVTAWILTMGVLMGTNAEDKGTSQSAGYNVSTDWIDDHTSKYFTSILWSPGNDWSWRTIRNQMRLGALCRIGFGTYEHDGDDWDRVNGHSVMGAGFSDDGNGNRAFIVADPNNDSNIDTQASFNLSNKQTSDITFTTEDWGQVTHARYTFNTGSGNRRYVIDSMHAVLPVIAGWTVNTDAQAFVFRIPFQMHEATFQWPTTFSFNTVDTVTDWCFDMLKGGVVYLAGDGRIYELDAFDGTKTQIANIPTAKKIAIGGPRQDLYVLSDDGLFDSIRYLPRGGGIGVIKNLGATVDALDFDPVSGGPVVTRAGLNKFIRFTRTLGTRTDESILSLSLIGPAAAGETLFKVDYPTGDYLMSFNGSKEWTRYYKHGNRRVGHTNTIVSTAGIRSLGPMPHGHTMLQVGSRLEVFDKLGNQIQTDYTGLTVPSTFQVTRSEFAADPSDFMGPGWIEEPPTTEFP